MRAEFLKEINYTLIGFKNTYRFLDVILIFAERSQEKHKKYVFDCLHRLDGETLRIDITKCNFSKLETGWLVYQVSPTGFSPLESKTSAILSLRAPKT